MYISVFILSLLVIIATAVAALVPVVLLITLIKDLHGKTLW